MNEKMIYEAPKVEVIQATVERGFSLSNPGIGKDDWGNGGGGSGNWPVE